MTYATEKPTTTPHPAVYPATKATPATIAPPHRSLLASLPVRTRLLALLVFTGTLLGVLLGAHLPPTRCAPTDETCNDLAALQRTIALIQGRVAVVDGVIVPTLYGLVVKWVRATGWGVQMGINGVGLVWALDWAVSSAAAPAPGEEEEMV